MTNINADLLQWSKKFFDKKTASGVIKDEIMSAKDLPEEIHKSIIRKFEKRKVY